MGRLGDPGRVTSRMHLDGSPSHRSPQDMPGASDYLCLILGKICRQVVRPQLKKKCLPFSSPPLVKLSIICGAIIFIRGSRPTLGLVQTTHYITPTVSLATAILRRSCYGLGSAVSVFRRQSSSPHSLFITREEG